VKYVDPDGRDIKSLINEIKEAGNSAAQFISNNKEALKFITTGAALMISGNAIKGIGVGGGMTLSLSSAGTLSIVGVGIAAASISAGEALEVTGAGLMGIGVAMMITNNDQKTSSQKSYREKTQGANANDKQQIDSVSKEAGIDRDEFGKFIHEMKKVEKRGPSDNYKYDELRDLAKQFKESQ